MGALKAYVEAHSELSIIKLAVPNTLRDVVTKLKPEDFTGREVSVSTVHTAIEVSRQSLLREPDPEAAVPKHVEQLQAALIDSVLETVSLKLGSTKKLPEDLRDFLSGRDGILDQLMVYTAYYLKTDQRAQIAILHFTLQEISDCQVRLAELCNRIYKGQNTWGKAVIDTLDDRLARQHKALCAHLELKFNDEHRPPLDPPFTPRSGALDFTYRARTTDFLGRETAMRALIEFLGDPRPGLWTVISGPAGNGKNRLAAELIAMAGSPQALNGSWRAGFLRNAEEWLRKDAVKWRRDADTLLVIDYASEINRDALTDFIAHISTAGAIFTDSQMRVILIDRLPPDSDLGVANRLMSGSDRRSEIAANYWKPDDADPLALGPVAEASALQIARDWAAEAWTPQAQACVEQALDEDGELGRPLFASLIGSAIRAGVLPKGILNPVSVASTSLDRVFARANPEFMEQIKILWAAATVCQGVAADDLLDEETVEALVGERVADAHTPSLEKRLRSLSGSPHGRIIPLKPDFLGGLFVLKVLLSLRRKLSLEKACSLMLFAWNLGSTPEAFLLRLASDFIGRESQVAEALQSTEDRVKELLLRLVLSGLTSEARKRSGPYSLALCAHVASRAGQMTIGFQLVEALEAAYSNEPRESAANLARDLARAWFGLTLAAGLPPIAREFSARAMLRIEELLERHNTADIAWEHARALANATSAENRTKCEELADRIAEIRSEHNTANVAFAQARALSNAAAVEQNSAACEKLADRIAEIRREHNTNDIADEQAKALYSAAWHEQDSARCPPCQHR